MGRVASSSVTNITIPIQGAATDATVERVHRAAEHVFAKNAPSVVNASVSRVAEKHRRDPSYLRR